VAYCASLVLILGPQAMSRAAPVHGPGVEHGIAGPRPHRFGHLSGGDGDPERSLGAALRWWVEQRVVPEQVTEVRYRYPNDPVSGVVPHALRVAQGCGVPGRSLCAIWRPEESRSETGDLSFAAGHSMN